MQADGKRWIIHGSRSDEFKIWNLADLHVLAKACAEDRIAADVEAIRSDPYSFWLGGGDYGEFIGYRDSRFDPNSVADWVDVADLSQLGTIGMRKVRDIFRPIKHKCLGLALGNHEEKYALATEHEDLQGWLCAELGTRNLRYSALFDVVFVRKPGTKVPRLVFEAPATGFSRSGFRFYVHHGAGYAQTPGGKLKRLIDFMDRFDADVYMVGHVHDQVGRRHPTIGADETCTDLRAHEKVGLISGSYLKTYAQNTTTYGEKRAYAPTTLGAAWVAIKPETRQIRAEI